MKDTEHGGRLISSADEPIERVIERCRFRIDRSLDCNVGDIMRLMEEVERLRKPQPPLRPAWDGLGSGD
jgi:hypothetical protein